MRCAQTVCTHWLKNLHRLLPTVQGLCLICVCAAAAQTVCTYWLKNLCMKGDDCGFLHQYDPARMPVCRTLLKFGECKEPDCPFKHSMDDVKVLLAPPPGSLMHPSLLPWLRRTPTTRPLLSAAKRPRSSFLEGTMSGRLPVSSKPTLRVLLAIVF